MSPLPGLVSRRPGAAEECPPHQGAQEVPHHVRDPRGPEEAAGKDLHGGVSHPEGAAAAHHRGGHGEGAQEAAREEAEEEGGAAAAAAAAEIAEGLACLLPRRVLS